MAIPSTEEHAPREVPESLPPGSALLKNAEGHAPREVPESLPLGKACGADLAEARALEIPTSRSGGRTPTSLGARRTAHTGRPELALRSPASSCATRPPRLRRWGHRRGPSGRR
eukprot:15238044-Heterocapsa_arctica.AAC.1